MTESGWAMANDRYSFCSSLKSLKCKVHWSRLKVSFWILNVPVRCWISRFVVSRPILTRICLVSFVDAERMRIQAPPTVCVLASTTLILQLQSAIFFFFLQKLLRILTSNSWGYTVRRNTSPDFTVPHRTLNPIGVTPSDLTILSKIDSRKSI